MNYMKTIKGGSGAVAQLVVLLVVLLTSLVGQGSNSGCSISNAVPCWNRRWPDCSGLPSMMESLRSSWLLSSALISSGHHSLWGREAADAIFSCLKFCLRNKRNLKTIEYPLTVLEARGPNERAGRAMLPLIALLLWLFFLSSGSSS